MRGVKSVGADFSNVQSAKKQSIVMSNAKSPTGLSIRKRVEKGASLLNLVDGVRAIINLLSNCCSVENKLQNIELPIFEIPFTKDIEYPHPTYIISLNVKFPFTPVPHIPRHPHRPRHPPKIPLHPPPAPAHPLHPAHSLMGLKIRTWVLGRSYRLHRRNW